MSWKNRYCPVLVTNLNQLSVGDIITYKTTMGKSRFGYITIIDNEYANGKFGDTLEEVMHEPHRGNGGLNIPNFNVMIYKIR